LARAQGVAGQGRSSMSNVAKIEPQRQSLIAAMASERSMEPAIFAKTVKATCMPGNVSDEEFAAFLMVAQRYGLDPITKEIYAFPKKGGGIQPIVGIDGWMNLINSNPNTDGLEFRDDFNEAGALVAITAIIHRKDRKHPTMVTEYMEECKRPSEPWTKWPARMLRHKAAIQCARYAFGFAGIIDPEEAERSPEVITETVAPPPPPAAQIAAPVEEPFDLEGYMMGLTADLDAATSPETLQEAWDAADVERTLSGLDDRLAVAFALKQKREEALSA
jgi:phage recombination protein Bet